MWKNISDNMPPLEVCVLAKWSNGHVESCEFDIFDGCLVHWLDDGEVAKEEPIEWMEYPQ